MGACGGCSARRKAREAARKQQVYDVMGGHKYLPERQLSARLETFKKIHCKNCDTRFKCDFGMYSACKKRIK